MSLIDDLTVISNSGELESYIANNSQSIHDYFNSPYERLSQLKGDVKDYVQINSAIRGLDLSKSINVAYLELLLNYCERFSLSAAFLTLYNQLADTNSTIGKRLEAAALFLINIEKYSQFLDNYDAIIRNLHIAAHHEEDSTLNVVITFVNYYALVIKDCGSKTHFVEELRKKIAGTFSSTEAPMFIRHELIRNVLSVNYKDFKQAAGEIQELIEKELGRPPFSPGTDGAGLLIEENTDYVRKLAGVNKKFHSIRSISVAEAKKLENFYEISESLDRGVGVLQNEEQMYVYLMRYGNMHKAKMDEALKFIPITSFQKPIEIIDWACGQAVASISYLELIREKNISQKIEKITLIEPSTVCIKRATAHIKHISNSFPVKTVNKLFDDLTAQDVRTDKRNVKIHFFSNILDVNKFSIQKLIDLIAATQEGENYFVCVSPSITDVTNDRIDSFIRYFKDNHQTFELLANEHNSRRGPYWNCNHRYNGNSIHQNHFYCGGRDGWTRLLKVFRIT